MKPLKHLIPAAAALGALVALPATAAPRILTPDTPAFYLGGGVGANRVEDDQWVTEEDDLNETTTSYKGLVGMRFNRVFSVEGQYINFGTAEGGRNEVEATGWNAGVLAHVPLWQRITPYAKGGVLFWNSDRRVPAGTGAEQRERDGDGQDFSYGLGVKFNLTPRLDLRTEYERFAFGDLDGTDVDERIDGVDVDMASLNLIYNF